MANKRWFQTIPILLPMFGLQRSQSIQAIEPFLSANVNISFHIKDLRVCKESKAKADACFSGCFIIPR